MWKSSEMMNIIHMRKYLGEGSIIQWIQASALVIGRKYPWRKMKTIWSNAWQSKKHSDFPIDAGNQWSVSNNLKFRKLTSILLRNMGIGRNNSRRLVLFLLFLLFQMQGPKSEVYFLLLSLEYLAIVHVNSHVTWLLTPGLCQVDIVIIFIILWHSR